MIILGISALYHDSAAAIIEDGKIVAAAQEERFTRVKHDNGIPYHAMDFCLSQSGYEANDLTAVVYYDNPLLSLNRFANMINMVDDAHDLISMSYSDMVEKKIWVHKTVCDYLGIDTSKFFVAQHHASHAASAFYPSPFESSLIITLDGVGEWATSTIGIGTGSEIKLIKKIDFPDSLGLLYSAFTYYCGFKVNSGDYKFMGLAPYGEPIYVDVIKDNIIKIFDDGSFKLNMKYFDYQNGRTMITEEFESLFGGPRRVPESRITKKEMDIAASVQLVLEEIVVRIAQYAKSLGNDNIDNLVMAGGVALNCVANGVLLRKKIFNNIWIQPAAGDAGGALGAALLWYYQYAGKERVINSNDSMSGSYLGPQCSDEEIDILIKEKKIVAHKMSEEEVNKCIAKELTRGKIVGLCRGRMEFGPRALGNRSIIADPRNEKMQSILNLKIKYRESFRPFAPSVLQEVADQFFELEVESPYMLLCANVKTDICTKSNSKGLLEDMNYDMLSIINQKRSIIPAVTHVDYSARIQTVLENRNGAYYKLIKEFEKLTGCGVVVNTSFNVRGEPIVCTAEDAFLCFMRTGMDILVLNDYVINKSEQEEGLYGDEWKEQFPLD